MSGISLYQVSRLSGQADRIPRLISVVAECLSYLALTSSFKDDSKPGRSRIGPAQLQPASRQDPGGAKAATHPHVFEAVQARQHARTERTGSPTDGRASGAGTQAGLQEGTGHSPADRPG